MPKNLPPGEALLRALLGVVEAGDNWAPALRDAVSILRCRAHDVGDQREAIRHLPQWSRDSLDRRLRALGQTCSDFAEALDAFLVDAEPDPFNYPPNALLVAAAATIVSRELELAFSRVITMTGRECV